MISFTQWTKVLNSTHLFVLSVICSVLAPATMAAVTQISNLEQSLEFLLHQEYPTLNNKASTRYISPYNPHYQERHHLDAVSCLSLLFLTWLVHPHITTTRGQKLSQITALVLMVLLMVRTCTCFWIGLQIYCTNCVQSTVFRSVLCAVFLDFFLLILAFI